ncbi:hypothetical protein J4418_04995 [Candidatus Woesearchaeota archaeon]|nr:hypothetical protein [Candidatus Woesearchaeota archaeon]
MNNKFLSIIIILILASFVSIFTILVSAEWEEEPSTEGRVHLFEGWNIVSYYAIDEWNFDALQKNEITAIFMYNSFDKEYIRLYPNHDVEKMKEFYSKLVANKQDHTVGNMAIWVYSNKEQIIQFNTRNTIYSVSLMDLKKGWNFLAITNEFKDEINWDFTFDEYKGTCDIQKIYLFFYNQWLEVQLNTDFAFRDALWSGVILKVSNDCNLGEPVEKAPSAPPTIPS